MDSSGQPRVISRDEALRILREQQRKPAAPAPAPAPVATPAAAASLPSWLRAAAAANAPSEQPAQLTLQQAMALCRKQAAAAPAPAPAAASEAVGVGWMGGSTEDDEPLDAEPVLEAVSSPVPVEEPVHEQYSDEELGEEEEHYSDEEEGSYQEHEETEPETNRQRPPCVRRAKLRLRRQRPQQLQLHRPRLQPPPCPAPQSPVTPAPEVRTQAATEPSSPADKQVSAPETRLPPPPEPAPAPTEAPPAAVDKGRAREAEAREQERMDEEEEDALLREDEEDALLRDDEDEWEPSEGDLDDEDLDEYGAGAWRGGEGAGASPQPAQPPVPQSDPEPPPAVDTTPKSAAPPAAEPEPRHLTLQEAMAMYRRQSQAAADPEPEPPAPAERSDESREDSVLEDDSLLDDSHLAEGEARFNEDEYDDDLDQEDFDEDEELMKNGGWHDDEASPQYQDEAQPEDPVEEAAQFQPPDGSSEAQSPAAGPTHADDKPEQPSNEQETAEVPSGAGDSRDLGDLPASEEPPSAPPSVPPPGPDAPADSGQQQQLADDSISDLISGAVLGPELMQAEVDGTAEDLSEVKDMLSMLEEKPDLLDAGGGGDAEPDEGAEDEEPASSEADGSGSESDRRDGGDGSEAGSAESDAAGDGARESPKPKRRKKKKGRKRKKKRGDGDSKDDDENGPLNKRRNIRQIMTEEKLDAETLRAQEEEKERQLRLAEQKKWYEQFKREQERVEREKEQERLEREAAEAERKAKEAADVIVLSSDEEKEEKEEKPEVKKEVKKEPAAETSDDDIQLLSSGEEEKEDGHAEDTNNSGSHTDDTCNVPDSLGRVLVNVGHPPAEMDIFIAPQIARNIKPHQVGDAAGGMAATEIGGVRFLYDNLIESQERCKTTPGFGCILAHSMGLGKTMQTVTFTDIFLRHTGHRTVLIIVPINTIQNWLNEFNFWLPDANTYTPLAQGGEVRPRHFAVSMLNDSHRTLQARAKVIADWYRDGGVLLIGYELYRLLNISSSRAARKKKRKDGSDDLEAEAREKQLLGGHQDGHHPARTRPASRKALKSIRTRRRLALTGYPLQNCLVEYWCMVDFVRPNFLGTKAEFNNMFERPISNGQCVDSTPSDVRLMRFRSHVLHSLLEGLVQRRSHAILQATLPKKEEYVCLLRMTQLQRALYQRYMLDLTSRSGQSPNPLRAFVVSCKIWNHPDILYNLLRKKMADEDLDLDETNDSASNGTASRPRRPPQAPGGPAAAAAGAAGNMQTPPDASPLEKPKDDGFINYDWAQDMMQNYIPGQLENSTKMMVFKVLLEETVKLGDKMLLFSQSLFTLNIIEEFLQQTVIPGRSEKWMLNQSYYRLDGSTTGLEREKLISDLGVNLVGANRVLVFDASWNPCHDTQAVCRVYRFGQQKRCYIYRLVTDNCLERRIYDRQLKKQSMSNRIVDETNPDNMVTTQSLNRLLDPTEDDPPPATVAPDPDKFSDPVLLTVLDKLGHLFSQEPFEHDAQLVDRQDKRLTQAEKRLAKRSYELEKKAANTGGRPNYQGFYQRGQPGAYRGLYNKPVANVRPMMVGGRMVQQRGGLNPFGGASRLSTEQLSRQGVSMSHITVPKDVTIPTGSGDGEPIQLRAGQTVLVIRTAKGVYLRLQDGRIIAIRMPAGSGGRSVPDLLGSSSRYQPRPQPASAAGPSGIRLPRGITVERVPAGGSGGGKQGGQSWARRAAPARATVSRSAPARSDSDSGDGGLNLSALLGRQPAPKDDKGKAEQPATSAAPATGGGSPGGGDEKQTGGKAQDERSASPGGTAEDGNSALHYLDRALAESADNSRADSGSAADESGLGGSPAAGQQQQQQQQQDDPSDPLSRLKSLAVAASGDGRQEPGMPPSSMADDKMMADQQRQQLQGQHQQMQQQQQQQQHLPAPHQQQQHHPQQQMQHRGMSHQQSPYHPDLAQKQQQHQQSLAYQGAGQQRGDQAGDEFMDTHIFDLSHKPGMEQQSAQDLSGGGGQGLDLSHLPQQQQSGGLHGQLGGQSGRMDHQARMELQLAGQPARVSHPMDGQAGHGRLGGGSAGSMSQLDQRLGLTHGHSMLSQPHDLSMHGQQPALAAPEPPPPPRYGLPAASQYGGSHQARTPGMEQYGAGGADGSQLQTHRHKAAPSRPKSGYPPHQSPALHQPHLQLAPEPSHAPPQPPPQHLGGGIDDLIAGFDLSRPTYSSAPAPTAVSLGGVSTAPLPSFSTVSQLPLPSFSSVASSGGGGGGGGQPAPLREPLPQPQPMDTAAPSAAPPVTAASGSGSSRLAEEPFPWELGGQYPAAYSRELGYAGYPPYSMAYSQPPGAYGAPAPYPAYGLYGAASAANYGAYRYPAGYQPFGGPFGVPGLPQPYGSAEPSVSAADFSLGGAMAPGEPTYRRPQ
ncbi:Helicase ARIP4 [Amphibalanus amphitrite]|uniref:Helicase ARIP4 n=1 Tax=Amphibalanus amphitrite TaxID=1232801 RepID=A0A6A4VIR7_AMPAM|nr:Helicase ARIP4 [Amphibalanus amphitrite]